MLYLIQYEKGGNTVDLLEQIKNNRYIQTRENKERGLVTARYVNGGVDFNDKLVRVSRGLTLDYEGNIVTRGFEKFFNYRQLDKDKYYDDDFKERYANIQVSSFDDKLEVQEKLDGTMILLGEYKGEFVVSTTSSTESPYSPLAEGYFNNLDIKEELLSLLDNKTLAFEYVSPSNQVVVEYEKDEYVLLALIDNLTGEEMGYEELLSVGEMIGSRVYEKYFYTMNELLDIQKNGEGIEGYIVTNKYGKKVKFKLDSWFEESKIFSIFTGSKLTKGKVMSVIEHYLTDDVDDLIAFENQHMMLSKNKRLQTILTEVERLVREAENVFDKYEKGEIDRRNISQSTETGVGSLVFSKIDTGKYITEKMKRSVRNVVYDNLTQRGK